jgi:hypothetical protein
MARMRNIILTSVFLVLVGACNREKPLSAHAAHSQTPTVETCQANANAWIADFSSTNVAKGSVSYLDLLDRSVQMSMCASNYPEDSRVKEFSVLVDIYQSAAITRLSNFVERRNLYSKFLQEDAAGQR